MGAYLFGCACMTQAKEVALYMAPVVSYLSGLQLIGSGCDLSGLACTCRQMMRARLHACVAPRNRQSLLRRRISVQIASALPQKIPLLVDFVFTLSTSTACDSGSGQYEAPAMRRMVTCSLSARPATRALRAWSPPCANTPLPPHVGACNGHVTTTPLPQGTWTGMCSPHA